MYTRLLVPLDDSDLSMEVLPHARQLARRLDIPVTLLAVVATKAQAFQDTGAASATVLSGAPASEAVQRAEGETADAERHLEDVRRQLENGGVRTETQILAGDPADVITQFAAQQDGCVICMATSGRGGVSRFALGSVADEVIRKANTPVFLINARRDVAL